MIKIGVITPTFNRPDLFERLHHSLVINPFDLDWCHFVVDDGSTKDYTEAFTRCKNLTGRIQTGTIVNSGPLVARNRAIDMAVADGCTHLCFIDDDDEFSPNAIECIVNRIREFPDQQWFMFASQVDGSPRTAWPSEPITVSWFEDVVINQAYGSDNLLVISSDLVGSIRFDKRIRNQREWTFFLDLANKGDQVLVCPEMLRIKRYYSNGLSGQAAKRDSSPQQVVNSIERAFRYWQMRPMSMYLALRVFRQVLTSPIKLIAYYISHRSFYTKELL